MTDSPKSSPDIAISAEGDDDGGIDKGAVYILFMKPDGTVRTFQKISQMEGGFTGNLDQGDSLGNWITALGDLDGDGITDIAVSARGDDDGGNNRGAIWVMFLNRNGTVKDYQKISDTQGGFTGVLNNSDCFGCALEGLGDFDNDGVPDLATGAQGDDDGGTNKGAVWLLMLNTNGTVKRHYKISDTAGGFIGGLDPSDQFGHAVSNIGDFDGNGVTDIAVGAQLDDDGGPQCRSGVGCSCSTPMVRSTRTTRSATPQAGSAATWTPAMILASPWRIWATWTATG